MLRQQLLFKNWQVDYLKSLSKKHNRSRCAIVRDIVNSAIVLNNVPRKDYDTMEFEARKRVEK